MRPIWLLAWLLLWSPLAGAESPCTVRSAQDILRCTLENHPEIAVSQAALDRDLKLPLIARQRPNPELETKIVGGKDSGSGVLDTETSLFHTIELGGKRRARISQASASGEVTAADHQKTLEEVTVTTVLTLYRLGQIQSELAYLHESMATFQRIVGQLKSRPLLTPEQSVSNSVFELALEDYKLKEKSLLEEELDLKTSLEIATGLPYSRMKSYLPEDKKSWPKVSETHLEEASTVVNANLQKVTAESKLAQANLSLAKSQSWPDLKIGPTVETGTLGGGNNTLVGGSLALPLPLLNHNGGGRQFAAAEKARADLNLRVTRERLDAEREKQKAKYETAVKVVSQARSHAEVTARHRGIDDLFDRGLVPSSLVIESHRQMVELTQTLHEQELAALEALWKIYVIDGKTLDAKL